MKKMLLIACLVISAILATQIAVGAYWDLGDMMTGKQMIPHQNNGAPWIGDGAKFYLGIGQDVYLSYENAGDKLYINGTEVYIDEAVTFNASIGVNGTVVDDGSIEGNTSVNGTLTSTDVGTFGGINVTELSEDLAANSTRLDVYDVDFPANVTRIATLETDLAANDTRLDTIETDLPANVTRIAILEGGINETATDLSISAACEDDKYGVDASSGNVTMTLEAASGFDPQQEITIYANADPGSNYIKIIGTSDTVAGLAIIQSTDTYPAITLFSDGENWWPKGCSAGWSLGTPDT